MFLQTLVQDVVNCYGVRSKCSCSRRCAYAVYVGGLFCIYLGNRCANIAYGFGKVACVENADAASGLPLGDILFTVINQNARRCRQKMLFGADNQVFQN